jgi:hypothetical protein
MEARFDVINLLGQDYVLRNGTGVGIFAIQFGPLRGFFGGLKPLFGGTRTRSPLQRKPADRHDVTRRSCPPATAWTVKT